MQYLFMGLFAALIVAADQITKYLTVANIPFHGHVDVLPGIVGLTYVQNTGAAWSSFQGMIWLFALLFGLFTLAIVWAFGKKKLPFTALEKWCIAAVWAGGLGNMIDRLRLGYVVDMIQTEFITFPIFNVADCFICCGCIALLVSLFFCNKEFWKDTKK